MKFFQNGCNGWGGGGGGGGEGDGKVLLEMRGNQEWGVGFIMGGMGSF